MGSMDLNESALKTIEYGTVDGTSLVEAQRLVEPEITDALAQENAEIIEQDGVHPSWISVLKEKAEKFKDRVLPKNIDYVKVGSAVLAGALVIGLVSGCAAKPVSAETVPTANATDTLGAKAEESQVGSTNTNNTGIEEVPTENIYPTPEVGQVKSPVPEPEKTATVEVEPLHEDFGLESFQIYNVGGYDVDLLMQYLSEKYPKYPHDYIVYTSNDDFGSYSSERSVNSSMILDQLQKYRDDYGPMIIREEKVLESVMGSGLFSDYSVKDRHQMVVLVTEEEGEDGIIRNAFYSYSSDGIVVFVDEDYNNRTLVWKGDNIDTKDPQVRSLIEEGYSNIRKKDGKYFAIGEKVGDLPQRNNISLGR